jgi:ABC-type Mn2+/Zn2+ transport system ATPase subunit
MIRNAPVLILDEPTTGLDAAANADSSLGAPPSSSPTT